MNGNNFSISHQLGLRADITHPKNERWSTLFGVHFGDIVLATTFITAPEYLTNSFPPFIKSYSTFGNYVGVQAGLGYLHPLGRFHLQHSFSLTSNVPFLYKGAELTLPRNGFFPTAERALYSDFSNTDYNSAVLFGIEYQLELLFKMNERLFLGGGFVANYSEGQVMEGLIFVDNGRTLYTGAVSQLFSKLGITARVGFQLFDPKQ